MNVIVSRDEFRGFSLQYEQCSSDQNLMFAPHIDGTCTAYMRFAHGIYPVQTRDISGSRTAYIPFPHHIYPVDTVYQHVATVNRRQ